MWCKSWEEQWALLHWLLAPTYCTIQHYHAHFLFGLQETLESFSLCIYYFEIYLDLTVCLFPAQTLLSSPHLSLGFSLLTEMFECFDFLIIIAVVLFVSRMPLSIQRFLISITALYAKIEIEKALWIVPFLEQKLIFFLQSVPLLFEFCLLGIFFSTSDYITTILC